MSKVSVIVPVYNVEKYIGQMLESVRNQSFGDFEVVMVNDGSTDGSLKIMEEFCTKDSRFKVFNQPNCGVAEARNRGIEIATGEYVVFYDPDDYIPKDALKKMYHTASCRKADIVVGVMVEKSLGETLIYMHSQNLAKKRRIAPFDSNFFGAWSLCHKMFSLDFIKKNRLRIEKINNAEDGVFVFCALNSAKEICGCNTVAYNYIKRPFWMTPSATQIISKTYMENLLISHRRILAEAEKLAKKYLTPEKADKHLQKLYIRFIEVELLNGYYRGIWRAEENLVPLIRQKTNEYKKHISNEQWRDLVERHWDLQLDRGLMTRQEMAENPLVSIIIQNKYSKKEMEMFLGSLLNQGFPRFEVIVDISSKDNIPISYRGKENIILSNDACLIGKALSISKGEYVAIVDSFIMFNKNTLRIMTDKLEKDNSLSFVSILMKNFDGKTFNLIPCLNSVFGYTKFGRRSRNKLMYLDSFFANKLFRKSALENANLTSCSAEEMMRLYNKLDFERIRKGAIITDISERSVKSRAIEKPSNLLIKILGARNIIIDNIIYRLKRHLTKDFVERIKEKIRIK